MLQQHSTPTTSYSSCVLVTQSESIKQETRDVVTQILLSSFPDRFKLHGQTLLNTATGEAFDLTDSSRDPMNVVARLVQVCPPHSNHSCSAPPSACLLA